MTEEQEFEALKDMFLTDGWKLFLGYLEADAEVVSNCRYLKSNEELFFAKGKLSVLDDIIHFETKLDAANETSE